MSLKSWITQKFIFILEAALLQVQTNQASRILRRCKSVGDNVGLRMPVIVYRPENLSIGENVSIGEYVHIRAGGGLSIGSRVLIASHVVITTVGHPVNLPRYGTTVSQAIEIKDDVWIGANAVILPGVCIGRGAIVGAGAVVTNIVEPFTVVGGVPATTIARINND